MTDGIDWEAAIHARRSTRSYEIRPVEPDTMAKLKDFAGRMPVPFEHSVNIRFFAANATRRLYGNTVTPPPDHAAFMVHTDELSVSKAGFVGEMLILYATSMGLATCWYGHFSQAELEKLMPHPAEQAATEPLNRACAEGEPPQQRAICITPFAYRREDGLRIYDRISGALMSHRRKPLRDLLLDGVTEESLTPDVLYALELARKAPSAANGQYWRFHVSPDCRGISIAMPVGHRRTMWKHPNLDIGICACHFWLGLGLKGVESDVTLTEEEGRAVWRFSLKSRHSRG